MNDVLPQGLRVGQLYCDLASIGLRCLLRLQMLLSNLLLRCLLLSWLSTVLKLVDVGRQSSRLLGLSLNSWRFQLLLKLLEEGLAHLEA